MTSWLPPDTLQAIKPGLMDSLSMVFQGHTLAGETMQQLQMGVDGISQATPLDTFKTGLRAGHSAEHLLAQPIYSGVLAGLRWQGVNVGTHVNPLPAEARQHAAVNRLRQQMFSTC